MSKIRSTILAPEDHLLSHLKRAADNPAEMNVNGSIANPQIFEFVVPSGAVFKRLEVFRIDLFILDNNLTWEGFGGRSQLSNGLLIQALDDQNNIQHNFDTDVQPIRRNSDFVSLAGNNVNFSEAPGLDLLTVEWYLFRTGSSFSLWPNWSFRITVQDDLTSLNRFRSMIQGTFSRTRQPSILF